MSSIEHRPVNYGPFGRNGYVLATSGLRGWLLDHLWRTRSGNWRETFTWQRAIALFAITAILAWGIGHLGTWHRQSIVTGKRFSITKTADYTIRHSNLRVQNKAIATFVKVQRRRAVPRSQRAWISAGDYWLDFALQTLGSGLRYLLLIIPLVSLIFWWQRRHADQAADAFGHDSPEHVAARRPPIHDWAAQEARQDWVLNPPRSESSDDPKNSRRPAFGRET